MNSEAKKPVTLGMLQGRLATIERQDEAAAGFPLTLSINGVGFSLHSGNFQISEKGGLELSLSTKEVLSPASAGTQDALGAVLSAMDHARAEHSLQFGPLLSCPCCGCLAEQTDSECGHRVECTWCGLATEVEVEAAAARRTWNTRVERSASGPIDMELDLDSIESAALKVKKATPGEPWYYQEKSDAYTHIVRVDNPALNNSLIVTQLSQRTDGVSESIARYIAAVNPDVTLHLLHRLRSTQDLMDWRADVRREVELMEGNVLQGRAYKQGIARIDVLITAYRNAIHEAATHGGSENLEKAMRADQELREGVIEGLRMLQSSISTQLNLVAWGRKSDLGRIVECRCAFTWKPHGDFVVPLYAAQVANTPDDVYREIGAAPIFKQGGQA